MCDIRIFGDLTARRCVVIRCVPPAKTILDHLPGKIQYVPCRTVGRVSYCLALNGPCVSTDTACSSSLVAAHLARRAVGVGDAAAGVAAGVNLALLHINTSVICAIGALSPVGRCKALDATADGYGRGEGCGVFVIGHAPAPRLLPGSGPAAAARVLVMVASAVNQDGRSSALTAPHGPSQQALLADIAREEAVGGSGGSRFIAMHGTGTGLGDPIETAAQARSFLGRGDQRAALGAPKAHYGRGYSSMMPSH